MTSGVEVKVNGLIVL